MNKKAHCCPHVSRPNLKNWQLSKNVVIHILWRRMVRPRKQKEFLLKLIWHVSSWSSLNFYVLFLGYKGIWWLVLKYICLTYPYMWKSMTSSTRPFLPMSKPYYTAVPVSVVHWPLLTTSKFNPVCSLTTLNTSLNWWLMDGAKILPHDSWHLLSSYSVSAICFMCFICIISFSLQDKATAMHYYYYRDIYLLREFIHR